VAGTPLEPHPSRGHASLSRVELYYIQPALKAYFD